MTAALCTMFQLPAGQLANDELMTQGVIFFE